MTKKTYDVKAKGIIGLAMSVEAESQEQAEALAEKETERFFYHDTSPWYPRTDGYTLEIESVVPAKTYPQCPPRKFIPTYDD